jgi:hypothetical protein
MPYLIKDAYAKGKISHVYAKAGTPVTLIAELWGKCYMVELKNGSRFLTDITNVSNTLPSLSNTEVVNKENKATKTKGKVAIQKDNTLF